MRRLDLKTGYGCNNNCMFCAVSAKKKLGDRSTEELLKDLRDARARCDSVVFTGGEVTIRKDILQLIAYAKELGYSPIQLQSNVRMLSYNALCRRFIDAGVTEFAPALHGPDKETHDHLTKAKGSFDQTVAAIRNLRGLGQYIITNSVIVKTNYKKAPELARLLVSMKVDQFQFAFMHACGSPYDKELMPRMSDAVPFIKQGLQIGIDAGIKCMAEAIPFCQMIGYEKYCSEHFIPAAEIRDAIGVDENFEDTRKNEGKIKFNQCKECVYDQICEGPWKEYPLIYGDSEFAAVR